MSFFYLANTHPNEQMHDNNHLPGRREKSSQHHSTNSLLTRYKKQEKISQEYKSVQTHLSTSITILTWKSLSSYFTGTKVKFPQIRQLPIFRCQLWTSIPPLFSKRSFVMTAKWFWIREQRFSVIKQCVINLARLWNVLIHHAFMHLSSNWKLIVMCSIAIFASELSSADIATSESSHTTNWLVTSMKQDTLIQNSQISQIRSFANLAIFLLPTSVCYVTTGM